MSICSQESPSESLRRAYEAQKRAKEIEEVDREFPWDWWNSFQEIKIGDDVFYALNTYMSRDKSNPREGHEFTCLPDPDGRALKHGTKIEIAWPNFDSIEVIGLEERKKLTENPKEITYTRTTHIVSIIHKHHDFYDRDADHTFRTIYYNPHIHISYQDRILPLNLHEFNRDEVYPSNNIWGDKQRLEQLSLKEQARKCILDAARSIKVRIISDLKPNDEEGPILSVENLPVEIITVNDYYSHREFSLRVGSSPLLDPSNDRTQCPTCARTILKTDFKISSCSVAVAPAPTQSYKLYKIKGKFYTLCPFCQEALFLVGTDGHS